MMRAEALEAVATHARAFRDGYDVASGRPDFDLLRRLWEALCTLDATTPEPAPPEPAVMPEGWRCDQVDGVTWLTHDTDDASHACACAVTLYECSTCGQWHDSRESACVVGAVFQVVDIDALRTALVSTRDLLRETAEVLESTIEQTEARANWLDSLDHRGTAAQVRAVADRARALLARAKEAANG